MFFFRTFYRYQIQYFLVHIDALEIDHIQPGYTKYYWTPELVLPVRVREGMYTLINFPNWEVIENVYIGDGQSFNAEIQGPSSLMVYPDSSQFVGVDTNMICFWSFG